MKKIFLLLFISALLVSCGKEVTTDFTMDKDEITVGEAIQFTNTSSGAVYFHWKFDDGSTSREPNPKHIFMGGGDYYVLLHAINEGGDRWDDEIKMVRVNGFNSAFIDNWAVAESYTTDSCPSGNNAYTMVIRTGDKYDEVWVDHLAGMFNQPVLGKTPYGDANKIEFDNYEVQGDFGEVYRVVGNITISNGFLTLNYTVIPFGWSDPCGAYYANGTGVPF